MRVSLDLKDLDRVELRAFRDACMGSALGIRERSPELADRLAAAATLELSLRDVEGTSGLVAHVEGVVIPDTLDADPAVLQDLEGHLAVVAAVTPGKERLWVRLGDFAVRAASEMVKGRRYRMRMNAALGRMWGAD